MNAPDPMTDPEGYALWCELHACRTCEGTGEVHGGPYGEERTCGSCDGSGVEPSFEYEPEEYDE